MLTDLYAEYSHFNKQLGFPEEKHFLIDNKGASRWVG